jgi:hypothetical protein
VITDIQIFDRQSGYGRLDAGFGLVDMEELLQETSSRRDWLINGSATGYAGLVSIFEDGSFVLSEHSQSVEGTPEYSVLFGHCEVKE